MVRVRDLLALPRFYRFFQKLVGGDSVGAFVRTYVRPHSGMRVFDIGCGPGGILEYLPQVAYVGIDISDSYIQAARNRFGDRGVFRCQDVAQAAADEPGTYQLVLAMGILHHLSDAEAASLLTLAKKLLRKDGRFISIDPCYVKKQSLLAKCALRMDRGKFVRNDEGYLGLVRPVFSRIQPAIRHDLLRIPYTHLILECA